MKLLAFSCLLFLCQLKAFANDGAYYASGNQLIPVFETDVAVTKEILTIRKVRDRFIEVTVYYEFFNPGKEKDVVVGFEAFSPFGDVDGTPKQGLHPYMRDFTVELNGSILQYEVAYVSDSLYAATGKIVSRGLDEVVTGIEEINNVDFYYVYHFNAHFKSGKNIVRHTYNYDLSGSIERAYDFNYILTAANRWANKQIDDFTLIVDMGEFEAFSMDESFFTNPDEWIVNGIGKSGEGPALYDEPGRVAQFTIQKGNLIFRKTGFKPRGELFVYALNYYPSNDLFSRDQPLPFSYYQQEKIGAPETDLDRKILKNLPFARRGYVFSNKEIQRYFESNAWYIPNPNYKPEMSLLTDAEKEWVKRWE